MKTFSEFNEEKTVKSNALRTHGMDGADRRHHAKEMQKKFGVASKYHTAKGKDWGSHVTYHGDKENVKKAIAYHAGGHVTKAAIDGSPHLYKQRKATRNPGIRSLQREDAPVNAVGGGNIASVGVGPDGEPGVSKKDQKKKKLKVISRLEQK